MKTLGISIAIILLVALLNSTEKQPPYQTTDAARAAQAVERASVCTDLDKSSSWKTIGDCETRLSLRKHAALRALPPEDNQSPRFWHVQK